MITIITSTLNCRDALRLTGASISRQDNSLFQWVVIDGGSTDGTLNVINDFSSIISYWITEKDNGIYDAWNKACKEVCGEWVIFLGAGDTFASDNLLSIVSQWLKPLKNDVVFAYGNVIIGNKKINVDRIKVGEWDLYRPKLPCHQAVFQRSQYCMVDQPFDPSYKIVADSKFLLQLQKIGKIVHIPLDITIMAPGGLSQSWRTVRDVRDEFLKLEKDMGYKIPFLNKILFHVYVHTKYLLGLLGCLK